MVYLGGFLVTIFKFSLLPHVLLDMFPAFFTVRKFCRIGFAFPELLFPLEFLIVAKSGGIQITLSDRGFYGTTVLAFVPAIAIPTGFGEVVDVLKGLI